MGRRTNCIHHRRSGPRYFLSILPNIFNCIFFPAFIIDIVGLGISTIVFVIEIIFHITNKG